MNGSSRGLLVDRIGGLYPRVPELFNGSREVGGELIIFSGLNDIKTVPPREKFWINLQWE